MKPTATAEEPIFRHSPSSRLPMIKFVPCSRPGTQPPHNYETPVNFEEPLN
jgi:hypothetical protein